jgi:UDP-N-acetylmuramate--alanine ligase
MDSFLDFYPTSAVVLNIEMDHVDYFNSMEHIKASFSAFMAKATYAIVNIENEDVMSAAKASGAELISFGSSGSGADFTAENVSVKHGIASFDIVYRGKFFCKAKPSAPGMHMICDCLAAAAAAFVDGIDGESIERGIHEYRGIGRRMDNRGKTRSGADVYDDYAHHPTEIANTLEAACQLEYENVYCVFQPHTFSRTAELLEGFADVLGNSKTREIILAEIYPAREINTYGISSEKLACEIRKRGKECRVFGSFDEIAEYMNGKLTDKDTLFVVGAGDINKLSKMMVK